MSSTQVAFVNLSSGAVELTLPITHIAVWPLSAGVSLNGALLAVGIPTGPRGYYEFGPYESYFASFDLLNRTKIGEFLVDEDIAKTLVTGDGTVIVAGGSGQWAGLRMFDARSGTESGTKYIIWQYSSVAMHPSERRMYAADETGLSPPRVVRYDFVPRVGFSGQYWWPHHGVYDPGGAVWASLRGDQLLTGSGLLLVSRDNASQDMYYDTRLVFGPVTHVAFGVQAGIITIAQGGALSFFDMDSRVSLGTASLPWAPTALAIRGNELLLDFGDRISSLDLPRTFLYGVTPTKVFPYPGSYVVTLAVRDTGGQTAKDAMTLTVRDITPPLADAGPDHTVWRGDPMTFDGGRSTDNVGIVGYSWTFTDGTAKTLTGKNTTYTFQTLGTILVTLTVTDAAGNAATDTLTVMVNRDTTAPVARAGPDRTVREGTLLTFDDSASTDNVGITSAEWTFTDGVAKTISGPNASYRFTTPGTYAVTLTVRDREGNVGTDTLIVTVQAIPLVLYDHPRHGFRIGMPEAWEVRMDYDTGRGLADFLAVGPVVGYGQTNVVVVSEPIFVAVSDEYLLAQAQHLIAELTRTLGALEVVEAPAILPTVNAHAAVFEVCYTLMPVCQVVAIVASESRLRQWTIIGSVQADSIEEFRPHFSAVIRSFTVLDPLENPAAKTSLASVAGVTLAGVAIVLLGLRRLASRRRKARSAETTPSGT